MVNYHLITLFPESTESYLNASILGRARERGLISMRFYNPRDFVDLKKKGGKKLTFQDRRVDDRPYGGGPGMVIEAMPVIKAIEAALKKTSGRKALFPKRKTVSRNIKIVFFSPAGTQFSNSLADKYKKYTDIILVCGRYEGIDARVKKAFPMAEISVGPYVLTGGELPAMVLIDAITRRIPGVLGDNASVEENRVCSPDVYTRPEVIEYKGRKYRVPRILLSGHHAKMDSWKRAKKLKG